ncbi:hypothetical protein V6Z96_004065 [Aspergillus fumigatus]
MAKKSIAVVMRGSTTATDILNDVDTIQVTTTLAGILGRRHDEVIADVQSLIIQYPGYALEPTGHSLGGALTHVDVLYRFGAEVPNYVAQKPCARGISNWQPGICRLWHYAERERGFGETMRMMVFL